MKIHNTSDPVRRKELQEEVPTLRWLPVDRLLDEIATQETEEDLLRRKIESDCPEFSNN